MGGVTRQVDLQQECVHQRWESFPDLCPVLGTELKNAASEQKMQDYFSPHPPPADERVKKRAASWPNQCFCPTFPPECRIWVCEEKTGLVFVKGRSSCLQSVKLLQHARWLCR